jgi:hypothetical protein
MNPGGGPTPDKPDISVVDYEPGNTVSGFRNLRVADVQACYERWSARGAEFVTPPIDRGAEIRCYRRDPEEYFKTETEFRACSRWPRRIGRTPSRRCRPTARPPGDERMSTRQLGTILGVSVGPAHEDRHDPSATPIDE